MQINEFLKDFFNALKEQKLDINYTDLVIKGIIKPNFKTGYYELGEKYIKDSVQKDSVQDNEIDIEALVEEFRKLFKQKLKTLYGSKSVCIKNMEWFLKEYPEYADKNIILEATKEYLRKSQTRYTRQAHYFIKKSQPDKSIICDLETYCALYVEESKNTTPNKPKRYNGYTAI